MPMLCGSNDAARTIPLHGMAYCCSAITVSGQTWRCNDPEEEQKECLPVLAWRWTAAELARHLAAHFLPGSSAPGNWPEIFLLRLNDLPNVFPSV